MIVVAAPYPLVAGKITSKQLPFAKKDPQATYISQVAAAQPAPPAQPVEPPAKEKETAPPAPSVVTPATATEDPAAVAGTSPPPDAQSANAPPVTDDAEIAAASPPPATAAPNSAYTRQLVLRLLSRAGVAFCNSIVQGFKWVFIPLYLLGQVVMLRSASIPASTLLIAVLATTHICILFGVFILSGYIANRHVLPLVALAMPATALGLAACAVSSRRLHVSPQRATLTGLAIAATVVVPYTVHPPGREFLPVLAATRWVQSHAEPGAGVVCNSPYVGFYSKLPVAELGERTLTLDDTLARAGSDFRCDYVLLHVAPTSTAPSGSTTSAGTTSRCKSFPTS